MSGAVPGGTSHHDSAIELNDERLTEAVRDWND